MDHPATVVLPIHNGERLVRALVMQVLEISESLNLDLNVMIVDDGSTDETYETACELAVAYPQILVLHQPVQRGLGPALDRVRRVVADDRVIVHDGFSPLDTGELLSLLRQPRRVASAPEAVTTEEGSGSRRFAAVASLHAAMERAHEPLTTFRWLKLSDYVSPRRLTTSRLPQGSVALPRKRSLHSR